MFIIIGVEWKDFFDTDTNIAHLSVFWYRYRSDIVFLPLLNNKTVNTSFVWMHFETEISTLI